MNKFDMLYNIKMLLYWHTHCVFIEDNAPSVGSEMLYLQQRVC